MKVLVTGGGTGGHIFPALTLGEALMKLGNSVLFIADQRAFNFYKNTGAVKTEYLPITSPRKGYFKFTYSLFISLFITYKIIKYFKPDIIVAFGGYTTLPVLLLSIIFRKTIILHEANSILGKVNKVFSTVAAAITTGFKFNNNYYKKKNNIYFTGNPIPPELKWVIYPEIQDSINILVFAGSQGAKKFSEFIPPTIALLKNKFSQRLKIYQQCRNDEIQQLQEFYKKYTIEAEIKPFFEDLSEKMRISHLIICRAGALTISEINTIGRLAIYIPYPNSSKDHQTQNALVATKNSPSITLSELNLSPELLCEVAYRLLTKKNLQQLLKQTDSLSCETSTFKLIQVIKMLFNSNLKKTVE